MHAHTEVLVSKLTDSAGLLGLPALALFVYPWNRRCKIHLNCYICSVQFIRIVTSVRRPLPCAVEDLIVATPAQWGPGVPMPLAENAPQLTRTSHARASSAFTLPTPSIHPNNSHDTGHAQPGMRATAGGTSPTSQALVIVRPVSAGSPENKLGSHNTGTAFWSWCRILLVVEWSNSLFACSLHNT